MSVFSSDMTSWLGWRVNAFRFCVCVPFPEELGVRLNNGGSFRAGLPPGLSRYVEESLEVISETSLLLSCLNVCSQKAVE